MFHVCRIGTTIATEFAMQRDLATSEAGQGLAARRIDDESGIKRAYAVTSTDPITLH